MIDFGINTQQLSSLCLFHLLDQVPHVVELSLRRGRGGSEHKYTTSQRIMSKSLIVLLIACWKLFLDIIEYGAEWVSPTHFQDKNKAGTL